LPTFQGGKNMNIEAVQDKRDIQTEITFSMLSVRVAEIRGEWIENRNQLVSML
jgi:expansin (peptidoglycan-binding protein)